MTAVLPLNEEMMLYTAHDPSNPAVNLTATKPTMRDGEWGKGTDGRENHMQQERARVYVRVGSCQKLKFTARRADQGATESTSVRAFHTQYQELLHGRLILGTRYGLYELPRC